MNIYEIKKVLVQWHTYHSSWEMKVSMQLHIVEEPVEIMDQEIKHFNNRVVFPS